MDELLLLVVQGSGFRVLGSEFGGSVVQTLREELNIED
jgi:hypothetical protein